MTLPFRRRHHDDEAPHDRARALISAGLDGPLDPADETWLSDHLARCHECAVDAQAYRDDRALLRALRDRQPVPPRDLWARTSAAIEQERRRSSGAAPVGTRLGGLVPPRQRLPLGVLSGALVVLVVVAVALVPPGTPTPTASTAASAIAQKSLPPGPTQIPIADAARVTWIERTSDGGYAIVSAPVNEACPPADPTCAPLAAGSPTPLGPLAAPPQAVAISPQSNQVAVVGGGGSSAGSVIVIQVPTPQPTGTGPQPSPTSGSPTPPPTVPPTAAPTPRELPSGGGSSAEPSVEPIDGGHTIISSVQVVGDTAYSASGQWLAFSAKPIGSDAGPFLYVWHVGDLQAHQLTDTGTETYFAGWFGDRIVASEIVRAAPDGLPGSPPFIGLPRSFLLDPATGVREAFRATNAWLPSIDPRGRFVTYWAGELVPVFGSSAESSVPPGSAVAGSAAPSATAQPSATASGGPSGSPGASSPAAGQVMLGWQLGPGQLVLDGWSDAIAGGASPVPTNVASPSQPAASHPGGRPSPGHSNPGATATPLTSNGPSASPEALAEGPAGTVITLASGSLSAFEARFDPDGTRLAVWVADGGDPTVGRLWLLVLDPDAGAIRQDAQPLPAPGVTALHGFSLLQGRLGWVTPPGQDGEPSSVHVLAWNGDVFGQIQTVPGGNPQIVH